MRIQKDIKNDRVFQLFLENPISHCIHTTILETFELLLLAYQHYCLA